MISNHARVGRALYLLKLDLDAFIPREFLGYHQDEAANVLNQILGQSRDAQKPFQNMKTQDLLAVLQASWQDVFQPALTGIDVSMIREVALAHESWANRHSFSADAAFQTLTSIQKLLSAMSSPSTLELEMLRVESLESEVEALEAGESAESGQPRQPERPSPPDSAGTGHVDAIEVEEEAASAPVDAADSGQPPDLAEPYLAELVQALRESGALQEKDYLSQSTVPVSLPEYADPSILGDLHSSLSQALIRLGVEQLQAYQGRAMAESLAGCNVALTAGWTSDETLSYAVPLAETLLRNPGSHGLVLCSRGETVPQVYSALNPLLSEVGVNVRSWSDDTAAPDMGNSEDDSPIVLVTTPGVLNRRLLGDLANWADWLGSLKFVAIKQAQEFSGFYGANVAVLMRRLSHALAVSGASPRFFLVSHGCANGTELAENLTGKTFQAVAGRSGPAARRHYLFTDPREAEVPARAALADRVSRAVLACIDSGKPVLVYSASETVSRNCYEAFLSICEEKGIENAAASIDGGESPRKSEGDATETGSPGAVFTASLPAGAGLDQGYEGVILAGFPEDLGAAMALMEVPGGLVREEGFLLYFASSAADDPFFARNLGALLEKQSDQVVFDADHSEVILPHLASLVQESGGRVYSFSREILGSAVFHLLRRQAADLSVEDELPPAIVNLENMAEQRWSLRCEGETIAEFGPYRKFRQAYPGAIINIGGVKYRYLDSDDVGVEGATPIIVVESSEGIANLQTEPYFEKTLDIREESLRLALATGVSLNLGAVELEERLTRIRAFDDSSMPDSVYEDQAGLEVTYTPEEEVAWTSVSPAFWIDTGSLGGEDADLLDSDGNPLVSPGVATLEQMFRLGSRFTFPAGPFDLATHSEGGKVFLIEVGRPAQGVAKKAFDLWREILVTGADLASRCPCQQGCLYCIVPPSYSGADLDKAKGLELVDRLLEATQVA